MDEPSDPIGPVKSQSRDGVTVTHYRPLVEVLTILIVSAALIGILSVVVLLIAAAVAP